MYPHQFHLDLLRGHRLAGLLLGLRHLVDLFQPLAVLFVGHIQDGVVVERGKDAAADGVIEPEPEDHWADMGCDEGRAIRVVLPFPGRAESEPEAEGV